MSRRWFQSVYNRFHTFTVHLCTIAQSLAIAPE